MNPNTKIIFMLLKFQIKISKKRLFVNIKGGLE